MIQLRRLATLLALLFAFAHSAAWAQLPAPPEGPIADLANVIEPADEAALDARLRQYNQETGRAIIVATVPSLDGADVAAYAQDLATAWDIGGEKSENGVLFLIAPEERELRIHTARGVQGRLTDIMSGRIIRDTVVPQFKTGNMSGGIVAGVNAIITQLDMDPAQARAIEEARATAEAQQSDDGFPIGSIIWVVFILFFFVLPMFRGGGRKRRFRGGGMGNVARDIILWEAGKAIIGGLSDGDGGGFGGGGGGGFGGGGFGGFGGGGGGFNGGGASGGW